ncbi:MAG: VWA domain-containing protein [Candidatus Methanosuratus sp.]|nr:VWA domain-containing protein [Candidatus Methanosuratincola sp.]
MGVSRVYLVDASGSMGGTSGLAELEVPKIELVKGELKQLLGDGLHFEMDDRVALVAFKNRKGKPLVKTILPFQYARALDENYAHLIGDISTINAEGGTPISAGLKAALSLTASEYGEREILLITDADYSLGEDPRLHIYDALIQHATINVIYLGASGDLEMLEEIARKTGGSLRLVTRPVDLHKYLFYPPDPPPLDPSTEELVALASSKMKEYDSTVSSAKDEGSAGEGPPAVPGIEKELREVKSRLLKRCEDLGRELAAMTLDRQEPLITLTGIRQMLERKRLSKKEYLKRASEIEEFLGGLVRNEKSKKQALSVLESLIADLDSRLFRSG